jgi:hypothetical protein
VLWKDKRLGDSQLLREGTGVPSKLLGELIESLCSGGRKHDQCATGGIVKLGSDIHVMLTLRRRSRQVVVTNKQLDGTNMAGEFPRNVHADAVCTPPDEIGCTRPRTPV